MSAFIGKRALVVGGTSGIGNGIARAFLDAGAYVTAWGTRASSLDYAGEAGASLNGMTYAKVDATEPASVRAAAEATGALDVLVLSQGTVRYGREEFTDDGFNSVVEVNLNSVMRCIMAFKQALFASRGSVVVVGSTAAFRATRGNPAYGASKAALVGLTRSLGQAWAKDGVRVNAIAPGLVDTKLTEVTIKDPERLARSLQDIPAGRLGTPQDMGQVALFLASPSADYIIGQTIIVDGGFTL